MMTNNIDPIKDSVDPLAELFIEHSHLTPAQATAMATALLEFCWGADAVTSERD